MSINARRFIALFTLLVLVGISSAARAASTPSVGPPPGSVPDGAALDEKLGQAAALDIVLRDEAGKDVSLRSLVDRPTILTLNYFRCGGICSPQLNGLARAIRHTDAGPGTAFRVITVSFDDRDTAEIAAKKQSSYLGLVKRPMPPEAWHFLTGDAATTKKLADSVGYRYKKVGNDFVHPAVLVVLSPKGMVTRYMYGISYLPADVDMAVQEAKRGQVQPTIPQWLQYCFSYDPKSRGYVLSVTRLAGAFVFATAISFAAVLLLKGRKKNSEPKTTES
jgi:protein SCO1/2